MSDASIVRSSVDDLTYESKIVGNVNQDTTTHDGGRGCTDKYYGK